MRTIPLFSTRLLLSLMLLLSGYATADEVTVDKTLSPYFKVLNNDFGAAEQLPLQKTTAQVNIAGVIADVKVRQYYRNRGQSPIDAVYVFPGSTRAAVYAMKMTIGERVVVAKIKERLAAKKTYQQAKKQGKRAALLEQQRPNVFQMNVANIMPGDQVMVELSYTELIIPEQGVYEFAYPAVVGPRYSETPAEGAPDTESWIVNPYLQQGSPAPYAFDMHVTLATGVPIQALGSHTHQVQVDYNEQGGASVRLKPSANNQGDRDFILCYQLKGKHIETGLLLHQGEQENYFLLMAQPPQRLTPELIPPREYIFVVDVSGSMHGFPLDTSKRLMTELLSNLRQTDSFNILFFSGGASMLSPTSLPVNPGNIQHAISMMQNQRGGGGTRLLPALQQAMAMPAPESTARSFVIVTDGYVSIETEAFDYVRNNLNQANFFAFGIGSSINRFLIEGLARAGQGEPFFITNPEQAFKTAQRFKHYIETPVLTGINVEFEGFDVYDVQPQHIPDLFAERPLLVYGKWRGDADGSIHIQGHRGGKNFRQTLPVEPIQATGNTNALRYLWARNRIAELGDYQKLQPNDERKTAITNLGLAYNLLTAYTSFVAVDEKVANDTGTSRKVKQPLPLPKGVSNLAVGGIVPTTPEPGMLSLLLLLLLLSSVYIGKNRNQLLQRPY